jgi:pyridinium-3,5-bisthiocarboxylic acid mononucleotide nickel chelatase
MRIAYLDCFSGMSGDMFLGALVDVGVSPQLFEDPLAALNIGAKLDISRVTRGGISATKVDVFVHGEKELPREVFWEQQRPTHRPAHAPSGHSHAQRSEPVQLREHNYARTVRPEGEKDDSGSEVDGHGHSQGRGLGQIREIIAKAAISDRAKKTATSIFDALGAAEAKIHDSTSEEIHFHEVGAVDAIVDIVCAAIGAEALGVDEIVCSPLNLGGGTVKCAHGTLPIPAPATLELLKGAPVYSSDLQVELVTPTGAAIVKLLASRFAPFPEMKIDKVGYGAGSRDFPGQPNVVRLTVGEALATHAPTMSDELITILESNLDDLNPQLFGYVMDRVLQAGALDAYGMPVQMKKNRPGTLLTVLAKPEDAAKLTQIIFSETSTLGVRHRQERRQALVRNWVTVRTPWGEVRMKLASMNGTVTNYAPEYEDCRRIAAEHHVPLKAVMQEAVQGYLRTRED